MREDKKNRKLSAQQENDFVCEVCKCNEICIEADEI